MIPTPHIEAKKEDISETVLMPGDPLRAKFIAETFLDDVKLYNRVRGMLGFTGKYKGKKISVQGSGMGIPSMGIYSYELYKFYNVKNIIRIGTAGSLYEDLKIKDIVIGMGACTDSNYVKQYIGRGMFSAIASYNLLECTVNEARKKGVNYKVGNILSSEIFYNEDREVFNRWKKLGVLAVEMEAAALFVNAAVLNKNAICILTVSDNIITGETSNSEERQKSYIDMMEIALDVAINV